MKRLLHLSLLLLFSLQLSVVAFGGELKDKLLQLKDVGRVEALASDHFAEKYVVRITQPLDHRRPELGSFTQRVIVGHAGFDRPTVIITEGYGGSYALTPRYQDELSKLINANIVFAEHRYFLESTPDSLDWEYLTAENSAYDLHHITATFKQIYPGKWVSTGISKGGQTTMIYRAYFPDDVDFSVPYVAPLNRAVEDDRQEAFLRKVGTGKERKRIKNFQLEILKRKEAMLPLLETFCAEKGLTFKIPPAEVLDYCVLEYSFAFWQWGTSTGHIPPLDSGDKMLFDHLIDISGPDYFSEARPNASFFVQAARELGYYGYDTKPFGKYLTLRHTHGYVSKIMLPPAAAGITFDAALYHKVYDFLKDNDPKMIWIYGEVDPWSATRVPAFKGKVNEQIYIQPRGSHRSRIGNMPEEMKEKILRQIEAWLQ
ncbi:MAG: aminopeptidase [Tannerellaceae bacterium]|nr:aminopeptidase [Tannerellaceae bacterium]